MIRGQDSAGTQRAQRAYRGVWEHAPQDLFCINGTLRSLLVASER